MEDFTYLGSIISSNLSLDAKLNTQIIKAVTAMAQRGSGKTPCWPSTPGWRCIKPVCSACCSMAVKQGLCTPIKNADSMPSTCTALEGFWASPSKTVSQTRMSWLRWEYQACLPCLPKGTCTGLVMSATCRPAKYPRMCCTASLPLAPDLQEGLFFASEMSVNEPQLVLPFSLSALDCLWETYYLIQWNNWENI